MDRYGPKKWIVVFAMGLTLGLILLDETVVGLSLQSIQKAFFLNDGLTHWIIIAYLVSIASTVALFGRLSDFYGLRNSFFFGSFLFTLGAFGAAFSTTLSPLVMSRALQGLGAAFLFPTSIAMVTLSFPNDQKGLSLGLYGSIGTLFPPVSGVVAGFILTKLNPQLIFLMPLPLLFVSALLLYLTYIPRKEHETKKKGALFDWYLFLKCGFTGSILVLFLAQFVKLAIVVFGANALQTEFSLTPYEASLALLPPLTLYPVVTTLAGYLTDKFGAKLLMKLALLMTTALFLFIGCTLHEKEYIFLLPPLILWALATPFLFVSSMTEIINSVSIEKRGEASGMGLTAQILGGAFAMSFLGYFQVLEGFFSPLFLAVCCTTALVTLIAFYLFKE